MSLAVQTRIRIATWRLRLSRLIPEARPSHTRQLQLWPWVALAVVLLLPWLTRPTLIPDTAEMLATGRCMLGLEQTTAMCSGLDMGRYPVLFPILAGTAWALGLSPINAAIGLALVAAALCCAVGTHALTHTRALAAIVLPGLILAVPGLREHLLMGDARGLMLLGLMGGVGWMLSDTRPGWQLGAWLGLALLARPEALLAIGALLILCAVWRRRALWHAVPIIGLAWAVQHVLQLAGGGARGWEMKLARIIKIVPDDWIFQLVGLGMEETAFRSQVIAADLAAQPSTTGSWEWLIYALPLTVPLWLVLGAALGTVVVIRARDWRVLTVLAALASPTAVVLFTAQAREQVLPAANLLPLLLSMSVLMAIALDAVGQGLRTRVTEAHAPSIRTLGAIGLGLCGILGVQSHYVQMDKSMEMGPAHAAAHQWVEANTPQDAPIAVSFRSGGIPLLAGRKRTPLPAAWEVGGWLSTPDRPQHFIISSIDSPGTHATLSQLDALAQPQALVRFEDETTVIWVYGLDGV